MIAEKLLLNIVILCLSSSIVLSDQRSTNVDSDGSFRTLCEHNVDGVYTRRANDHSEIGDLCKIKYKISTEGNEEAKRFCKAALPYRVISSVHGFPTICTAESLIVCPTNYIQINDQCFYLVDKHEHYTYPEAVEICEKEGAEIALIKKATISRFWSFFWPNLSMVWVRVTNGIAEYSITGDGDKNAILFTMAIYFRKRRQSLIRIDGTHRGMVICEKPHMKTGAYVLNKMKRYREIYYENSLVGDTGYFRTSNRYGRTYGTERENNEICKKVAKPFSYKKEQAYVPGDTSGIENFFGENLVIARAAVTLRYDRNVRENSRTCSAYQSWRNQFYVSTADERDYLEVKSSNENMQAVAKQEICDIQWSWAYFKQNGVMTGISASDAMRAPWLCQTHLPLIRFDTCASDEHAYLRDTGETVCHKLIATPKSWQEAQKYCEVTHNGTLSAFTSDEEMTLLDSMLREYRQMNPEPIQAWLGGRRTMECLWDERRNGRGFEDSGPCSKKWVFEWKNNAAPNGEASVMGMYWDTENPSSPAIEQCLDMFQGKFHWASWEKKALNDAACSFRTLFLCQNPPVITYELAKG